MADKRLFFHCEKCGKKIIERKPNGTWSFVFGKPRKEDEKFDADAEPAVRMKIHGSIKMRCLRRSCRKKYPKHWNTLNFFPNNVMQLESVAEITAENGEVVPGKE
jgi:hypothetical protein